MTKWNERLREAMDKRNVKAVDISKWTNVSQAAVNKWTSGKTSQLKYDDVTALCNFLRISPAWLMDGVGSIDNYSDTDDLIVIEQIDLKASCGSGALNFESLPSIREVLVSRQWIEKNLAFYNPKNVKIITAIGDSMKPEINDGDAVFIDISDTLILRDGIYFLRVDGQLFLKRIQRLVGNKVALISSNKAYKEQIVELDSDIEFRIIGRAIKAMDFKDL